MFIFVIIISYLFGAWAFRLSEKGNFENHTRRGQVFRSLLFRITWRFCLTVLVIMIQLGYLDHGDAAGNLFLLSFFTWFYLVYKCWRLSGYFKFQPPFADPQPASQSHRPPPSPPPPQPRQEDSSSASEESRHAKVLGLTGQITKQEIKAKYRELVTKYHPDKVSHLGDDFLEVAQRKIIEINAAYIYFKKKYGIE